MFEENNIKNVINEEIVKYTIDIDSRDKIIYENILKFLPLENDYVIKSLNPYEMEINFGNTQEKILISVNGNKQFHILNPYISKRFTNIAYIKILNCVFPRYYNVISKDDKSILKQDIFSIRYVIVKIDINENSTIYSTNQHINDCIKLKVHYSPNKNEKYIILTPLHSDFIFFFKYGQLKNLNKMNIKFYDDEYNQIILDYSHLINVENNFKEIFNFIKECSVNLQLEVGCYEINAKNGNDY